MTSVESAVPVKTPEPDQYWEHVKSKDRVYFIGRNPEGEMVWQCEGDTVEVGNLDWSDWQHIPDCTGWDWEFEAFPHYYVGTKWCDGTAYVVRESETKSHAVGRSGNVFKYDWDGAAKRFVAIGTLVRITEAEAMARLDKPAEQWPKYYAPDNECRYYYRVDSPAVAVCISSDCITEPASASKIMNTPDVWREVTEAEAKARVNPAGEWPKYVVNPDESCRWYIKLISENSAQHVSSTGIESPERWGVLQASLVKDGQWVEVTEAEAFARVVKPTEPDSDPPPFSKPFTNARSGMGIRKDAVAWRPARQPYDVETHVTYQAETRVESPDDWVTQDRVPARDGIDRGWWGTDFPINELLWWLVSPEGSAAGKMHGHTLPDGQMLHLICRRKILPAVPAPVEETFPQWYILKESEKSSWIPSWAVQRTGEETCIRYARDEAGEIYATNEPWTGGSAYWERCSAAEAIVRMGTSQFPAVPADKRRVPIKAWVTYRLADEGGDWPVRATPADQTYLNWKEIKFDSNGMFIEVDQ